MFVAALPPVVMAELGAVAVLPGALGFTGRFNLASVAVYLYLVQVVLLAGYVLSMVLGGLGGERAPPRMDQGPKLEALAPQTSRPGS